MRWMGSLLLWAAAAVAGTVPPPAYLHLQPAHRAFTDAEGLPQNTVLALALDRSGVLWAGTEDGPACFDGIRWERRAFPTAAMNMATALAADPAGGMWVGTGSGGVWRWREGGWEGPFPLPGGGLRTGIRALRFQGDRLWVAHESGLARWQGSAFEAVKLPAGLRRPEALLVQGGDLWVAGLGGLVRLGEGGPGPFLQATPDEDFRALALDGDGQLHVGGIRGVYRLEGGRLILRQAFPGKVRTLAETRDSRGVRVLWAGTAAGLWASDGRTWTRVLAKDPGLRGIHCLRPEEDADPHHGIWVGTDAGGLHRLEWSLFLGLTEVQGAPLGGVTAFAQGPAGSTFMVGLGPWLTEVDAQGGIRREAIPGPASYAFALQGDRFLLGTEDGRVLSRVGRGPWRERLKVTGGLPRVVLEDPDLGLLVGFRDGGLWQALPGAVARPIDPETCRALLRRGPWLYAGFQGGVRRFRIHGSTLEPDPGWVAAEGRPVGALVPWRDQLAVGTFTEGLFLVDPDRPGNPRVFHEGTQPALPHACVYAVTVEADRIWVGTNRGVALLQPQGPDWAIDTFFRNHGLPANETNHGGLHVDALGRLWVGTLGGAAVMDPRLRVRPSPRPLGLHVVGGAPGDRVVLSRGQRLEIRCGFPGFYREGDVRFRFQVEGLEAQPGPWRAEDQLEIRALEPGTYRVLAWARHPDLGIQGPVAVEVQVPSPWWRRAPVLFGAGGMVLCGLLLGQRGRERAYRRRARQLREEVEIRTADLREANEALRRAEADRMTLTTMIIHDVRSPLQAVMSTLDYYEAEGELPEEAQAQARLALHQVENLCNEVLELGRAAKGELHLQRRWLDLAPWAEEVGRRVEILARPKDLRLTLTLPVSGRAWVDPGKVDRVVMNLVGNALKFTPVQGSLGLEIACAGGRLCVAVSDSGPGIPEALRAKVFEPYQQVGSGKAGVGLGLTIVKTFVEAHGGRVWVEASEAGGASFRVEIPAQGEAPAEPGLGEGD